MYTKHKGIQGTKILNHNRQNVKFRYQRCFVKINSCQNYATQKLMYPSLRIIFLQLTDLTK